MSKKKNPLLCKKCGHNMGRSRCKPEAHGNGSRWNVRCNKCKQVYVITLKFPEDNKMNYITKGVPKLKKPQSVRVLFQDNKAHLVCDDHNGICSINKISKKVAAILISKGFPFEG